MNSTMFEDAIESLVFSVLKNNVHTIKPAVVTSVDYDEMLPKCSTYYKDTTI